MTIDLVVLLVLGFAAYRVTRFLIVDSFFEGTRAKFHAWLFNKQGRGRIVWEKLLELTSCTFCFGFWVSLVLYSLYFWVCPLDFSRVEFINVFAVAGIQSLLHAWEPD